jgi:hypothetical protein
LLDGGVPDAAALFAVLGVPEARRRGAAGALALALKAQGSAAGIALSKVQVALGDLAVEGEGKLDLSGMKPVLMGGALRGRAVDLDLVRALLPRPDKAVDIPGPWSEEKLDLSALGAWDGSVTLEADSLTIGHLPFTGLKTDVALKDGQLNINELHATLFNGPLTANLALRGGTALPGLAASVKFIQLEAGNLTQVVWGKSFLEAQIQGQLSLTTQGESTAAMAASASGGI